MIEQKLIDKFKKEDPKLSCYIETLNKFHVVGFEKQRDMNMTVIWLEKNKIEHEKNDRLLIWLPELKDSIKNSLRKP